MFTAALDKSLRHPAGIFLACLMFGIAGNFLVQSKGWAPAFMPLSGISLGLLLCNGRGIWPSILLAASISAGFQMHSLGISSPTALVANAIIIGSGILLQALAAAKLMQFYNGPAWRDFEHLRHIARFLLLSALSSAISPSIGIVVLELAGTNASGSLVMHWVTWWLGGLSGTLLLAPLVIAFLNRQEMAWAERWQAVGVTILFVSLTLVSGIVHDILTGEPYDDWALASIGHAALVVSLIMQLITLVISGRTISARRVVEQQNQALEAKAVELSRVLDSHDNLIRRIPLGVFKLKVSSNGTLHFDFVSPLWCSQLGLAAEDVAIDANRPLYRILPEDRATLLDALLKGKEHPQALIWEGRLDKLGEIRWLMIRATPTLHENGDLIWEGVQSDITESKNQEEFHRLLSRAMAQSLASVVITDASGEIVFVNHAFEQTTGYLSTEILGKNPRILQSGLTPLAVYQELWRTILLGKTWRGELQNRKKSGELYWELATVSPVQDAQGKITHFIAVKDNITERKQQEAALREAREIAESANLAKSQFLATMSHEIRTPMNGILGMAQLLLMDGLSDSERDDYVRTIMNSGQTLQALLNDILDLSKVEAGKLELHPGDFDPAQLLEETAALFNGPAQQKGLKIDAAWHGRNGQRYFADSIRIRQMLSNLLSNAIKFTDGGFIRVDGAEIKVDADGALLSFTVTDTGIGIPAGKKAELFQPFKQLDSTHVRRHGGSGLGLSIVQRIAQLMNGSVGVDSEPGQGSRFWFRVHVGIASDSLNTREVSRTPTFCIPNHPSGMSDQSSNHIDETKAKILIVEDNLTNQKVVSALLAKLGLDIYCVENGQLAVTALQNGLQPDLVLMDCQMPVMDGYEATTAIRLREQENNLPHLPIVALTADAFEEDRLRCLAVGMDDYLTKPVGFNHLKAMVDKWL